MLTFDNPLSRTKWEVLIRDLEKRRKGEDLSLRLMKMAVEDGEAVEELRFMIVQALELLDSVSNGLRLIHSE